MGAGAQRRGRNARALTPSRPEEQGDDEAGGHGRLPAPTPTALSALHMLGLSITQLFLFQETVGPSEPQFPHLQTRKNAHPSLPGSVGEALVSWGPVEGRHRGGGEGDPVTPEGLWFCSPCPLSLSCPRTPSRMSSCTAVALTESSGHLARATAAPPPAKWTRWQIKYQLCPYDP